MTGVAVRTGDAAAAASIEATGLGGDVSAAGFGASLCTAVGWGAAASLEAISGLGGSGLGASDLDIGSGLGVANWAGVSATFGASGRGASGNDRFSTGARATPAAAADAR